MYIEGTPEYEHHLNNYGKHKDFGYSDFIPMFKAEAFNAKTWIELIKASGAKYIMPVAEHHDGFQMYDSELSNWNAAKMGPKRDILGELKEASEKAAKNSWGYTENNDFKNPIAARSVF
jgi:alpha-L-fucosidase